MLWDIYTDASLTPLSSGGKRKFVGMVVYQDGKLVYACARKIRKTGMLKSHGEALAIAEVLIWLRGRWYHNKIPTESKIMLHTDNQPCSTVTSRDQTFSQLCTDIEGRYGTSVNISWCPRELNLAHSVVEALRLHYVAKDELYSFDALFTYRVVENILRGKYDQELRRTPWKWFTLLYSATTHGWNADKLHSLLYTDDDIAKLGADAPKKKDYILEDVLGLSGYTLEDTQLYFNSTI